MDHLTAVADHYERRAGVYDESAMHRRVAAAVLDLVGDPGDIVLDVGTGTGLVLRAVEEQWPGRRLVGVDLSPSMLRVARAALGDAVLVQADAAVMPVADTSIGVLTCVTALHLFRDPTAVFREWARVLRPGGKLATATFVSVDEPAGIDPRFSFDRRHEAYRSAERLGGVLAPFGFALADHTAWADGSNHLQLCLFRHDG